MDLPRAAATTGAGGGSPPAASHLSSPPYSPQAPAIGSSPGASRAQQQHRLNTVAPTTGQSLQHPLLPRIVTPTTAVATPAAPLEPAMDYGYFGNKESGGTNGGQMPLPPGSENPWSGAYTKTFMRGGSLCAGGDCGMAEAQRTSNNSDRPYSLLSKLSAEFVGTMLFVFVGSLSGVYANPQANSVIHAAFAHGLAIFVLIASFGHISGGHFNPAVTLGVALSGKLHAMATPLYWLAQLAGGFCAALLVRVVTNQTQYDSIAGGATIVPQAQHWQQALVTEALLTGFLVQTVLTCAVDTAQNVLAPLAIGMTVALDIFAGGPISGASMNPARSFGPCLAASIFLHKGPATRLTDPIWSFHFVYWAGPFLGAALAALLYRSLLGRGHNRLIP